MNDPTNLTSRPLRNLIRFNWTLQHSALTQDFDAAPVSSEVGK